jgi:hypothetical protein
MHYDAVPVLLITTIGNTPTEMAGAMADRSSLTIKDRQVQATQLLYSYMSYRECLSVRAALYASPEDQ